VSSMAGGIDGLEVRFDDPSLVAAAGLVSAGTVMDRLGLEALIGEAVRLRPTLDVTTRDVVPAVTGG